MKTIFFTGGGSGGHVMPAMTLIAKLLDNKKINKDFSLYYIGSYKGVERKILSDIPIIYKAVSTGKLRRYFSFQNFSDIFCLIIGYFQSLLFLFIKGKGEKILFSTGGFVSIPVVIAAKCLGFKIFIHEQTSRVGLANKVCSYFANKIFVSFEDSIQYFPKDKTVLSGYPLREECFNKNVNISYFEDIKLNTLKRPILFVTGGGNGSKFLNEFFLKGLSDIKDNYFIIHQVGNLFIKEYESLRTDNYRPIALVGAEMIDLFKLSDIIISRAGAGTVCELRALNKRSILIPLKIAQKNEQFFNAMENKKNLKSQVITEDELNVISLVDLLESFTNEKFIQLDKDLPICLNGTELLINELI